MWAKKKTYSWGGQLVYIICENFSLWTRSNCSKKFAGLRPAPRRGSAPDPAARRRGFLGLRPRPLPKIQNADLLLTIRVPRPCAEP